jgi:hypothetical protein
LLAVLAAYAAALARLPQQRSAIENFLREQTGFELRFERLSVQIGLYGPEAHFGDVTLWRSGSARQLLQAPELVLRFETWRLLRTGTLRPGRILVVGAEIDADALRELEAVGRRRVRGAAAVNAATPEQLLLRRVVDLAAGLPAGRIELESATLRGFERDADGATTGRLVSVPRLSIERSAGAARIQGGALLGGRLGRSLNLALELRGLDGPPERLEGAATLQARGVRIDGWRAALGLPRDGWRATADLRLVLRLRGGVIQGGSLAANGSDLEWRSDAQGGRRVRYPQWSGECAFERTPRGRWQLRGTDLRLGGTDLPAARVDWRGEVAATWRSALLAAEAVPLAWLRPALELPALAGLDGMLDSVELDLRREPDDVATRYTVQATTLEWRDPQRVTLLAPLALQLEGDADTARLQIDRAPTQLTLAGPNPQRYDLELEGGVSLRRDAGTWRARIDTLQLAERTAQDVRPRLALAGTADLPRFGDSSLDVDVTLLEPLDARQVPTLDRLAAAAAAVAVRDVALAAGRFTLRAGAPLDGEWRLLDSEGELSVTRASVAPGSDWPVLSEIGGRLRWDALRLRFDFERGEIAGLRLLRGSLERGPRPRWSVVLDGPIEAAVRAVAGTPLAARMPVELTAAGLRGPARLELRFETATPAPRWALQAQLGGVRWYLLDGAPPVEQLAGAIRVVDGVFQPARFEGRWLEQPVSLAAQRARGGTRWVLSGRWPSATMAELLPGVVSPSETVGWRVEAAAIPGTAARWRADAVLGDGAARSQLEFAVSGERGFELQRGAVRLGAGTATLPDGPELRFGGTLPGAELAQLAARWQAMQPLLGGGPPLLGDIELVDLQLLGTSLGAARLSFDAAAARAGLRLDGDNIVGQLRAGRDAAAELTLERLRLPHWPGRAALAAAPSSQPWALDLGVERLQVGAQQVGAVRTQLVADGGRLTLRELRVVAGDWLATGVLDCERRALRCEARAALSGGAPRAALELWGIGAGFDATRIEGNATVAWPVAPADEAWAGLDGELQLTALDGQLSGPVRLGLPAAGSDVWTWREAVLQGRFRGPRLEIEQLAFEGEQRLLLQGGLDLRGAVLQLEGQWWPQRELPQGLEAWPAAPTLTALARALRGRDIVPQRLEVVGTLAAPELRLPPLQSPAAP